MLYRIFLYVKFGVRLDGRICRVCVFVIEFIICSIKDELIYIENGFLKNDFM